ncbi:MAG: hypothetical protein ABUS79_01565 [Pseudomonadota bacterium]
MRHSRPAAIRRWSPCAVAIFLVAPAAAHAQKERVNLRAELGAEYDSNVHRAEAVTGTSGRSVVGSPLGRLVLGWSAADRIGSSQDVAFSILGAAKTFAKNEAHSENVGVVETSGAWRLALGDRMRLSLTANHYEAVQAGTRTEQALSNDARDFRSLVPTVHLARAIGESGTITLATGYRYFVYKPVRSYDFQAPVASLQYRLTQETSDGNADWEFIAGASVEFRRFQGSRLVTSPAGCTPVVGETADPPTCATVPDPTGTRHQDQFSSGYVELTRTGRVLVGGGYTLQWNRSNSFSETLLRHVAIVRFTAPLPLGFYLAARTELVYVTYAEGVPLAIGPAGQLSATIDEEPRSHIRAELSRDIGKHLQLIARYSYYVNPIGQVEYQRQTATLSLAFMAE